MEAFLSASASAPLIAILQKRETRIDPQHNRFTDRPCCESAKTRLFGLAVRYTKKELFTQTDWICCVACTCIDCSCICRVVFFSRKFVSERSGDCRVPHGAMGCASCNRHSQSSPCWRWRMGKNVLLEAVPLACMRVPLKLTVPEDAKSDPLITTTGVHSALASPSYKTLTETA